MVFVNPGNARGIEIVADHAFRRRGLFALQDKRGTRTLQGIIKTALAHNHIILETSQRLLLFTRFYPDGLIGDDFR
ncbi:hypothetical protein D3C87_2111970 [compost metagenome]